MGKMWFTMKHHGWGWVPITIEGWAVIAALVGWIWFVAKQAEKGLLTQDDVMIRVIFGIIVMLVIMYMKGPSPRWRWDKK